MILFLIFLILLYAFILNPLLTSLGHSLGSMPKKKTKEEKDFDKWVRGD